MSVMFLSVLLQSLVIFLGLQYVVLKASEFSADARGFLWLLACGTNLVGIPLDKSSYVAALWEVRRRLSSPVFCSFHSL